jgi:GT2 family glycosyltransferase
MDVRRDRPDDRPVLSVVIPCLNSVATLPRQLDALAAQAWDGAWEVVVADNGSTDDSRMVAESHRDRLPGLTVVDASDRRGQAHARNAGARVASGDWLVFVDADDEVAPGYLAAMARALEEHDFVAARYDTDSLNPDWVRATRAAPQSEGLMNWFDFLPYAGGGGLGIRRAAFDKAGGFDEDYWRSGQDIDFCWRVQLTGIPLEFVPDATVRVQYRATLPGMYRQGRHYGRGEAYLHWKYRDAGMPGTTIRQGVDQWRRLLRRLTRVRTRAELARWLRSAGNRVGRLQGSIRHRVVFL